MHILFIEYYSFILKFWIRELQLLEIFQDPCEFYLRKFKILTLGVAFPVKGLHNSSIINNSAPVIFF